MPFSLLSCSQIWQIPPWAMDQNPLRLAWWHCSSVSLAAAAIEFSQQLVSGHPAFNLSLNHFFKLVTAWWRMPIYICLAMTSALDACLPSHSIHESSWAASWASCSDQPGIWMLDGASTTISGFSMAKKGDNLHSLVVTQHMPFHRSLQPFAGYDATDCTW